MLPVAAFGATGHASTRVIFGAAALGRMGQARADATLERWRGWGHQPHRHRRGLRGVRGSAEALARRPSRERCSSPPEPASDQLTRPEPNSNGRWMRMGVDHVDLIQLHNLVEPDEWEDAVWGRRCVRRARPGARAKVSCSNIGVTGHGIRIAGHALRSIERLDLGVGADPRPISSSWSGPTIACDVERLLEVFAERGFRGPDDQGDRQGRWPDGTDRTFSWYEPLTEPEAIGRGGALRVVRSADVPEHDQ